MLSICYYYYYLSYPGTPRGGAGGVTARGPGWPDHYFTIHCLLSVRRWQPIAANPNGHFEISLELVLSERGRSHDHENTHLFGHPPRTRDIAPQSSWQNKRFFDFSVQPPLLRLNAHLQADLEGSEIWRQVLLLQCLTSLRWKILVGLKPNVNIYSVYNQYW